MVLKSDKNSLTLQLPDDLIGKTIEVIVFSIEPVNGKSKNVESVENNVTALKNLLCDFKFNSGGYKFDRNNANDYE